MKPPNRNLSWKLPKIFQEGLTKGFCKANLKDNFVLLYDSITNFVVWQRYKNSPIVSEFISETQFIALTG